MPSHRFTDNRGRQLLVTRRDNSHKLYDMSGERLDDKPLRPAVVTSLLQEIIKLSQELKAARAPGYINDKRQQLLDEIEWFASYPGSKQGFCLWCQYSEKSGHNEDCRWAAARGGSR